MSRDYHLYQHNFIAQYDIIVLPSPTKSPIKVSLSWRHENLRVNNISEHELRINNTSTAFNNLS